MEDTHVLNSSYKNTEIMGDFKCLSFVCPYIINFICFIFNEIKITMNHKALILGRSRHSLHCFIC